MMPVDYHKLATLELEEAIAQYEARSKGLGFDLLENVNAALEQVARFPQACPIYKNTRYRKLVIKRFPYVIFYREKPDVIRVAAVCSSETRARLLVESRSRRQLTFDDACDRYR